MQFTANGKRYDYDTNKLSVEEAVEIEERLGFGVQSFMTGLAEMRGKSLKMLVYLAMRREGESVAWDAVEFDVMELAESINSNRADPGEAPDPTSTTGSSSSNGSPPTLVGSSTSPQWPPT